MGNHTEPWERGDDGGLEQSSYTKGENWGFQINFMVPLDRRGLDRCHSIAKRQEQKMRLDYELVRALKCAELQQKGFTFHPKSPTRVLCLDVIPIASLTKKTEKKPWYKFK
ncbi:hypothetical protein CYYG_00021 [Cyanophage SS120-1]|uniref:Uncharacterized protein n=1 Tax=Cyanophage SS120-1 TaxID=616674 RepID=M1U3B2_9CAUD|nr:hypothetical protein CYYG_00021 [Cyanophage SS120-1]AGG54523.1 hypothetical protein CYYG_00021 [Cyanophage SS120-1]